MIKTSALFTATNSVDLVNLIQKMGKAAAVGQWDEVKALNEALGGSAELRALANHTRPHEPYKPVQPQATPFQASH